MKKYQIYICKGERAFLRDETNDIDEACDLAYELEKKSLEKFDATIIYDRVEKTWFGYHKRGSAYVLAK